MQRVIAYVDGYNLYYGLRHKHWRRFYWLNIQKMVSSLLKPYQHLTETKYFTTIVEVPDDKKKRQLAFLEALGTLSDFKIFYGHFLSDRVECSRCGHIHVAHHEKMTDVNIAVEMLTDAFTDRFDVALLITADSDLVGALRAIRRLFSNKYVMVAFPPARYSTELARAAGRPLHISRGILVKSVFPDNVEKPGGFVVSRPTKWV
jgi:uncharacterized LabA/DUF88 family protein